MYTILAIEASTAHCSIALSSPSGLWVEDIPESIKHSELLLPAIAQLMKQANIQKPDYVAVAIGPGAFTSVRIAVGTAQGLALGWGVPILAISTLAALAAQALRVQKMQSALLPLNAPSGELMALCTLDARMGEVYAGVYQVSDLVTQCVVDPFLLGYDAQLPNSLKAHIHIGNAASVLTQSPNWQLKQLDAAPHALDVLWLARQGLAQGHILPMDPTHVQPAYVRQQVAQTIAQRAASMQPN